MTQFTSFVAVEEMIVTDGGKPRRIDVPVEVPEGVNRQAVYGQEDRPFGRLQTLSSLSRAPMAGRALAETVVVTKSGANEQGGKRSGGAAGGAGAGSSQLSNVTFSGGASTVSGNYRIDDADEANALRTSSPEDQKRARLQAQFHPALLAVINRLKDKKLSPSPEEAKFIHNGKAEVQIWLTDKSDETMHRLKELGFEVVLDSKTAKLVIGRLPIEKLTALAELKSVRYVAPQMVN
jgi:Ca-activated chloride channel family protein